VTKTFVMDTPVRLGAPPVRRVSAVLRILIGFLVLSALVTQVTAELLHDSFKPGEYFSYFTIESSMMNVVVLLVGGALAWRWHRDTELFTSVRVAILSYAVITGLVYNVLLRNIPGDGSYEPPRWCNEVMHVWVPIFILLDWLLAPGRARVPWKRLRLVISYPLAWLAFTMIRVFWSTSSESRPSSLRWHRLPSDSPVSRHSASSSHPETQPNEVLVPQPPGVPSTVALRCRSVAALSSSGQGQVFPCSS
jgi:hypothetical protein